MSESRNKARNQPVNHVHDGQSGRTVAEGIRRSNGKRNPSSERRGLRQKRQPKPWGKHNPRFPEGKYQ